MPADLDALPYARFLRPLSEEPESEGDYDCVHIDGVRWADPRVEHARFTESAFTDVTMTGGSLRHTRFADVWVRDTRWIGTDLADGSWQDAELIAAALSGVDAGGAVLRRVRFEGCKLDSVNLRRAKLREVSFIDCVLRDTDFGGATLSTVSFPGTRLEGLLVDNARLSAVDLREAAAIDIASGIPALRGARITPLQLMDLAPALAREAGILVGD
ncbi:pentapeptide repeat-containing protein [Nocardia takedensis]|uniref:pentapeptide repeat-containing protein n=1 Tax=Nocardia takedensis TaxID=259390 RepID=UPI000317AA94|nr:pentapeptide repeat-containing protein [Nocardia takedensis]